jgi:hypothetical protein
MHRGMGVAGAPAHSLYSHKLQLADFRRYSQCGGGLEAHLRHSLRPPRAPPADSTRDRRCERASARSVSRHSSTHTFAAYLPAAYRAAGEVRQRGGAVARRPLGAPGRRAPTPADPARGCRREGASAKALLDAAVCALSPLPCARGRIGRPARFASAAAPRAFPHRAALPPRAIGPGMA